MSTDRLDATERKTRLTTSSTSQQPLQNAVPQCARQCLTESLKQGWACSENDAGCLCSRYSSQGFTVGELAYICLQQECQQRTGQDALAAYQICSEHPRAVTATHQTLTVPPKTETSTGSAPSETVHSSGSQFAGNVQASPTSTIHTTTRKVATSSTETAIPVATDSASSSTSSASSTAAAAVEQPETSTGLSTGQAVGISIACLGAVVLAIGLFYLFIRRRRRNARDWDGKEERGSYDFVDEAPPRFSPYHQQVCADTKGAPDWFYGQPAELPSEKRDSQWYRDQFPAVPIARYEKGSNQARMSEQSRSTVEQLLPEQPKATPPQMRTKPTPRPASTRTVQTVFEEDRSPPMPQAMFPGPPGPVGLPAHPKAFHYPQVAKPQQARYAPQLTQSPMSMRQPPLSLEIPKQAARAVKSPPQAYVPAMQLRQAAPFQREQRPDSDADSSRSAGSFLNYYASAEADEVRSPESPTPIDDEAQRRRPVPTAITVTKPTYPPRAVRTSHASDTSFESTDPDEPTPPDEDDRQLSPVREHSPISGIKYPKVPRSSNQAIPRSPPIGMSTSPAFDPRTSLSPKQARRPNALPVGAHTRQIRQLSQPQQHQQPRPTSQVPRKPLPSHQPRQNPVTPERQTDHRKGSLSGSTLAAKRRGGTAAHDMEKQLHISGPNTDKPLPPATRRSPHNSPLKGYGRVATKSASPNTTRPVGLQQARNRYPVKPIEVEAPMKSPLWEPKLTPSRKGEDLYLQVGVATPRTEGFGRDAYGGY